MPEKEDMMAPDELRHLLEEIFPAFSNEWDDDEQSESLHHVMFVFTPFFGGHAAQCRPNQLEQLANFINRSVQNDDQLENAISTCFLEHLHQINAERLLQPYLTDTARKKLRA